MVVYSCGFEQTFSGFKTFTLFRHRAHMRSAAERALSVVLAELFAVRANSCIGSRKPTQTHTKSMRSPGDEICNVMCNIIVLLKLLRIACCMLRIITNVVCFTNMFAVLHAALSLSLSLLPVVRESNTNK